MATIKTVTRPASNAAAAKFAVRRVAARAYCAANKVASVTMPELRAWWAKVPPKKQAAFAAKYGG
jgi:hypothetical protein